MKIAPERDVTVPMAVSARRIRGVKSLGSGRQIILYFVGITLFCLIPSVGRAQTFGCTPAMANDIVCENSKPGTPPSTWQISGFGDSSIQGFATNISVNRGQPVSFKIKTNAASYRLDIYRMGYYGGNGARKIATINPSATLPQNQPACLTNSATKLYDCGNWAVSASWTVPPDATSGIYFAEPVRADTGGSSNIFFIVRNDSSHSDLLFQTSDSSWQAYNYYGGNSLYGTTSSIWDPGNRAYKVSYNRPFNTFEVITWVFGAEYPMVRWLEANGYDVTYFTDVDSDRNGTLIQNHKAFMSNSHDEYWSGGQRTNVEAARDAGVNLAFFSGNEVFWKTRWENSIDGSGTPYRTLVCYKETLAGARLDPLAPSMWTGTWRDPRFSPPADGGKPENSLTGTIFMVNGPGSDNDGLSMKIPSADGKMRFWRNTSIANLSSGQTATLPRGSLGYEWDVDADNGSRPSGLFQLSTTTYNLTSSFLLDYGGVYGGGTATHHMTLYRASSGALVFGAGTVQWSWGLDNAHDNAFDFATPAPNADMRQATINLFADMGAQPATIQAGLLLATKSTDATPPVSTITSPAPGATLSLGVPVTVSGTASDSGGGVVGGVEVSVNGGQTWHPANGRATWTYSFTTNNSGSLTIKSRAVDDSGNIEIPGAGVTVSAGSTYSISGTISTAANGSGATVTLSGASSGTVTANGSGNYTFSGLATGSYTVTPSKAGFTFNPVNKAVSVSGANVTGVNFTATAVSGGTYAISGSVTPPTAGITMTLSGTASGTVATDGSGNYNFPGLANGGYTITPSNASFTFSPSQSTVTVNGANISGVNFIATAVPYQTLFTSQTPLEIGQSDGASVQYELGTLVQSAITGQITAVRFWKDAKETGTHTGRVWSVGGQLLASVPFANETASGWQQQALTAPLSIAANTTYVVSVNTGGSFYVATTGGLASQVVNGNLRSVVGSNGVYGSTGLFPTSSYQTSNYFRDIVFVPGTTYSVSGSIAPSGSGSGATVALSGATSASVTADGSGNYTFSALANGSYTVTPSKTGFTFSPTSAPATVSNANVTGVNFTATAVPTFSISGTINPATNGSGATVTLSGAGSATTPADASGNYSFIGLVNGTYTITPSKTGFTFSPTSASATVNGADVAVLPFTATAVPTYSLSGTITPSTSGASAILTLSGAASATTTADGSGGYTFSGLANGSYTVTPSKSGFSFSPLNRGATVNSGNVGGVDFTASVSTGITIDATVFGDQTAYATSVTTSAFSTTAPNELLLAMVAADISTSSGTNNTVTSVTGAGLAWALVRRTNTQRGTSEIWRAFATAPLTNVTVTANVAVSTDSSITVMSFRGVNTSGISGSGAIGNTGTGNGTTGTPTASLVTLGSNSLVVGVGEDWNAAPLVTAGPNQTVIHQVAFTNLAMFWAQRQNATTPASGTTVTINDTVPTNHVYNLTICEILAAP